LIVSIYQSLKIGLDKGVRFSKIINMLNEDLYQIDPYWKAPKPDEKFKIIKEKPILKINKSKRVRKFINPPIIPYSSKFRADKVSPTNLKFRLKPSISLPK
jgi:hypothetical protein